MTVRTAGRAAHSAYPHLGQSATLRLVQLLAELETIELPTDPVLGNTTINIGMLSGGVADNVVAPVGRGATDGASGRAGRRRRDGGASDGSAIARRWTWA